MRNQNGYATIPLGFHVQRLRPFLAFLQFIQGPGVQWRVGVGGAVTVVMRAGSPLENTQRYLYILSEGAPHRAPGLGGWRPTLVLFNICSWVMRHGETSGPEVSWPAHVRPHVDSEPASKLWVQWLKLHFKCGRGVKIHMWCLSAQQIQLTLIVLSHMECGKHETLKKRQG